MCSSDLYGASKRAMESIFRQSPGPTVFTMVRYGNVVASNGSVIPTWRMQADAGQPLTLTGRYMTRFWMGKSDAVQLIERALLREGGTISIPKMGALSIVAMAAIIAPGSPVIDLGVRSREKTHEDLIHFDEPVIDVGRDFILDDTHGRPGTSYTSDKAPCIPSEQFLSMLEEA